MKKKLTFLLLLHLCLLLSTKAQLDTIINRYREYLFRTAPIQTTSTVNWSTLLNAQGQWPDIDYQDKEPANWKISKHLERIKDMAMAFADPKSIHYHEQPLKEKIDAALDHWLEKRYQSTNWWHNEIGVPRLMRDIIVLLRNDCTPLRLQRSLEILAQLKLHDDYTGGNLIWCADLGLHYGALTNDTILVDRCRNLMVKEIRITTGEGIQPDYSFHQHGNRLQMYQYGRAFLWESLRIAWQLRATPLAFPEDKVNILTDFVMKGWQWMARGIYTVPGTMDRSASRKKELQIAPDLRPLIPFMIALQPARAAAFKSMEANGRKALAGYRYYPYSDFTAFHRPGFSFFLKTISTRTLATESINHENLKGKLLNSGDAYLIRNGREYTDLMPAWDWTHLPGVTAFSAAHQIDKKIFVGSVSNETAGLTAMDYVLKDKTGAQVLTTHKYWACYQDIVVCLLAGTKGVNIPGNMYTTLDQCRWQGPVTVNKPGNILQEGIHTLKNVSWIHHAGFAYIPLKPATIDLHLKSASGSWASINASETPETINEKIVMPVMVHDNRQDSATGYVLALCPTPAAAMKIYSNPTWQLLRNDEQCQALRFNDGTLMIAFYSPGILNAGKGITIQTDQPCLLLIKGKQLYASDPTHKGITVHFSVNGKAFNLLLPENGLTVNTSFSY
jgi:chondroitin AC lyase